MSAEPLADFFPSQSLYAMCFDNPVRFVDPFGLAPKETKEDEEEAPPVDAGGVVVIGRRPVYYWESSFDYFDIQDWFGRFGNADGTTSPGKPGGGGGGGGGSSSGSVYGGQVMQKYNDFIKDINGTPGEAIDLANYFTNDEIDWLVKTGRLSNIIGKANIFIDGALATEALLNGDIWSAVGHAYEAAKGRIAMNPPWGTLAVMGLEVGEAVFEIRKHNILIRQHVPPITLPFTPVGLEIEARNRYSNAFWGSFGY